MSLLTQTFSSRSWTTSPGKKQSFIFMNALSSSPTFISCCSKGIKHQVQLDCLAFDNPNDNIQYLPSSQKRKSLHDQQISKSHKTEPNTLNFVAETINWKCAREGPS